MSESLDIRWRQRFKNFSNALRRLEEGAAIVGSAIASPVSKESVQLLKEGILQRFEFTQELSWKVLKGYMEYQGIEGITGSRDDFRYALKLGIIEDKRWLNSITDRNITSHFYDVTEAGIMYDNVMDVYILLFRAFEKYMSENAR